MACCEKPTWKCVKATLIKHFLPIGLVLAIIIGLSVPQAGTAVDSVRAGEYGVFQTIFVCIIFFISGLTLKTDDVKKAVRAWKASLFGITSILLITPLLALVPQQLPFLPKTFQVGLLLFCTMPTTINSGVALASAAKGNFALALLLTVVSNIIGIFSAPFFLTLLLSVSGISIDPVPLLTKLMLTLLLPLVVGKAVREACGKRLLPLLKRHKSLISNTSNLCLIMIPWMKLSKSQAALRTLDAGAVFGLIGCGLVIHGLYLAFNYLVAHYILRLALDLKKSVVIMGSQKTLPMAMTILTYFPDELGDKGLITIPCVICHLTQIFADAFLAARWAHFTDASLVENSSAAPAASTTAPAASSASGADSKTPVTSDTVANVTTGAEADGSTVVNVTIVEKQ